MNVFRANRKTLVPLFIGVLGAAGTLLMWARAQEEHRSQLTASLTAVADANRGAMQRQLEQHMNAVHNLATYWQLYGLNDPDAWRFDSRMVLAHFPGVAWVGWVDRDSEDVRIAPRTAGQEIPQTCVAQARARLAAPGTDSGFSDAGDGVQVYRAVRTPTGRVGMLVAELSPNNIVADVGFEITRDLAFVVRRGDGQPVLSSGNAASDAPGWLQIRRTLFLLPGKEWTVEYSPTHDYLAATGSRWADYFLLTGLLLSLALGAIVYQIMRLREYSSELARANRALDAQVRELSGRDRELSRMNLELETRVASRTMELQEALRELETFSHSLSHDLRSPVGAVINFTAILEEDYGPQLGEEGMRLLSRIRSSADSAVRLLNELVQLTWVGQGELERVEIDMTELARGAFAEAVSGDKSDTGAQIEMEPLPRAWADPAMISRVFANLFSNALKFSRERQVRQVRVTGVESEGESVYCIADNGIGFDPALASTLFEPFKRLHSALEFEGTGLGLAIAAKVVRRQGGRIWAESDGQTGASVYFSLPAVRSQA
jgi:signal transduction histidine kinase